MNTIHRWQGHKSWQNVSKRKNIIKISSCFSCLLKICWFYTLLFCSSIYSFSRSQTKILTSLCRLIIFRRLDSIILKDCNNRFIWKISKTKNVCKSPFAACTLFKYLVDVIKWKISCLFWQNNCFYSVVSKQVEDVFKFWWPFQKSSTLINNL